MRALALLCLVAACGGGASSPPPANPEPSASERDLAELTAFADRACACTDRACTDQVDREMAEDFREMSPDWYRQESTLGADQEKRAEADLARLFKCIVKRGTVPQSLGVIVAGTFDMVRADICACADADCARRAIVAWDEAFAEMGSLPLGGAEKLDFDQRIVPEATACFQRGHALIAEEAVLDLKAIRKAACACEDAACAKATRAEADAWSVRHEKTNVEPRTSEEIGEIAREIWQCQIAAMADEAKQAIVDLTELRAAACRCTSAKCADQVQADFDAFLERNADVKGTSEDTKLIGELAGAMAACLDSARGE